MKCNNSKDHGAQCNLMKERYVFTITISFIFIIINSFYRVLYYPSNDMVTASKHMFSFKGLEAVKTM
jgi:hypothetical protein